MPRATASCLPQFEAQYRSYGGGDQTIAMIIERVKKDTRSSGVVNHSSGATAVFMKRAAAAGGFSLLVMIFDLDRYGVCRGLNLVGPRWCVD